MLGKVSLDSLSLPTNQEVVTMLVALRLSRVQDRRMGRNWPQRSSRDRLALYPLNCIDSVIQSDSETALRQGSLDHPNCDFKRFTQELGHWFLITAGA